MRQLFVIPILIFACFVFTTYFIMPQYFELAELKKQVDFQEQQLENTKQRLAQVGDILKELEKHQDALDKIEKSLPKGAGLPTLFSFLQKQSSSSGLILENLSPGSGTARASGDAKESQASDLKETEVSISVLGLLPSIEDYLKTLERSSRLIETQTIAISQEETEGGVLSCDLSIKVYHY